MCSAAQYIGQRLSLHSHTATVRWVGQVEGKTGEWLGVEWDDPTRGKNDGSHDGIRYFACKRTSPTAASFLRPTQPWDKDRTFLQAISDKYFNIEEAQSSDTISISRSKQIEEVGFTKFALRQAELKGIYILVLDRMQIASAVPPEDNDNIKRICAHITDLDLGGNLFDSIDDILQICYVLPKLRRLTLDSNRFAVTRTTRIALDGLRSISLSNTLFNEEELSQCLANCPNIEELTIADNALVNWHAGILPSSLRIINLSNNEIRQLADISHLLSLPQLQSLKLKDNQICRIAEARQLTALSTTLCELDLGGNQISDWTFFDQLRHAFPALKSLRVSGNSLYSTLQSADDKALAAEDGYMLTIARLPCVDTLNYSVVRDKDRLNAEKYYLSQIAIELSRSEASEVPSILERHPRWNELCEEYGEPDVAHRAKPGELDPNTLAARLVIVHYHFYNSVETLKWTEEVPRSLSIYALCGRVGKKLDIMPVNIRLVWETAERDPISHRTDCHEPLWWDSSDEDTSISEAWTMRNVDLVSGTRPIGTYLEGRQGTIRVELRNAS